MLRIRLCRRELGVLYGPPAVGKTAGVKEFIARKLQEGIKNLVFVTANPTTTPRALLRSVCQELGIPLSSGWPNYMLLAEIVSVLKRRPHLIIVDEASFLSVGALENMRYVYDQAHCGVIFIGVETLMERIFIPKNSRVAEELEQLFSRVDFHKYLPGTARAAEMEQIARNSSKLPDNIIAEVVAKSKTPRELQKVLELVKCLRELNPQLPVAELVALAQSEVFRAA
jgi:DNA transposition AAA+ family ATPase